MQQEPVGGVGGYFNPSLESYDPQISVLPKPEGEPHRKGRGNRPRCGRGRRGVLILHPMNPISEECRASHLSPPPPKTQPQAGGRQTGMQSRCPLPAGSALSPPQGPQPWLDSPAFPFPCSLRFRFPWQPHPQLQAGERGEQTEREGLWGWGGHRQQGCPQLRRTTPGDCVCRVLADI